MTCGECGSVNPGSAKFCHECGAALALGCPSCGAPHAHGQKFCGECGTALAATPAASAAGSAASVPTAERRLVTVLFADIVGFTALSESRDAEEVRELLSGYFETCRTLIDRYGGTLEKFIGDAVMAVWGTPVATEDDAERAVRAALDLTSSIAALGEQLGTPELQLRAGVLTGEAAVTLGAEGQGMVAGDMVNTASRIQSLAPGGAVYVGESTRRATEPTIVYEAAGSHELKGKAEPVPLWRALRVVAGVRGTLKSEGLEAPFVGRDRELRLVKELFHATIEESRAQLVSITGIAGIGKSRLTWEFYKYFDGITLPVFWHKGRCLSYGEGVAYWALADMVRMRARIAEDEEPADALARLRALVAEHVPDSDERAFIEPRLAHLLALADREGDDRADLFAAWRLFFERLADVNPTVLVFEDLQWADTSLLDFIEHLLEWSRNHRLYVVTVARPEFAEAHPTWGSGKRNFTSLYLEPLSGEAMEALMDGLVPGLPGDLRDRILDRAEGVPLYAVETVRMLLDRGVLVQEGSVYTPVGEAISLDVPETLHALIAARLDGLTPEERRLLQDGAVLGKTFTPEAIGALAGIAHDELESLLQRLVRKEVLSIQADPRSPERGQYGFLQDLVRRVAYETLSRHDRKLRHLAAAEHLSRALSRGGDEELAEVLASHYVDAYRAAPDADDAAQIKERARDMLVRAGERADSLAAAAEACRYFEQAAEFTDDRLEEALTLERAGRMAILVGEFERAMRVYASALATLEELAERRPAARVAAGLAGAERRAGHAAQAHARLEKAYASIADDEPSEDLAQIANRLASNEMFRGDKDLAATHVEIALGIAEDLRLPAELVSGLMTKAMLRSEEGRHEESLGLMRHALAIALENDLASEAALASGNLADSMLQRDRYADAIAWHDEAFALARRRGARQQEWFLSSELSYALTMLGRWDEALEAIAEIPETALGRTSIVSIFTGVVPLYAARGQLKHAQDLVQAGAGLVDSEDVMDRACYAGARATLNRAEGRYRDALAAALEAIGSARETFGDTFQSVKHGFVEACESALALGDPGTVEELISSVESLVPGRKPPFLAAQANRFRGRLAELRGELDAAESGYKQSAGLLRELELPFWLAVVLTEHGELLASAGRGDDAAPLLAEAREIFERLRATVWLERLGAPEAVAAT